MIVEACVETVDDLKKAKACNVDRIELNSSLFLGGLTPSPSLVEKAKDLGLKTIVMIRLRADDFYFDDSEIEVMWKDAQRLFELGADGMAFGALNKDCTINEEATKKMIALCHQYNKEFVFHRAIDQTKEYHQAIETLIKLGCDRILTSGHADTVMKGLEELKTIQKKYGNQIEILAGSGIEVANVQEVVSYTKVQQIHGTFSSWRALPYQALVSFATYPENQTKAFNPENYEMVKSILVETTPY